MSFIKSNSDRNKSILYSSIALIITISVIVFPEDAFNAAVNGLNVWWNVVFPALLPFFIMAQVMIGLGLVHFLGVFLEPVMRPVFNVPGSGSFVMAMGLASGFPIGAVLTTQLRKKGLCSKVEAERLISFTNTADPLFMFGAVAVGMIGYPETGVIIALAHYMSAISIGLLMRFYGRRQEGRRPGRTGLRGKPGMRNRRKAKRNSNGIISRNTNRIGSSSSSSSSRNTKSICCSNSNSNSNIGSNSSRLLKTALDTMVTARIEDGRPPGQLMGDAIRKSVETLMLIGGFIIIFSVIIQIMFRTGIAGIISDFLEVILRVTGISTRLAPALVSGLLELDLGCQAASVAGASLTDVLIICSFIIAWSGLSVHAQVASILSDTDISITPFIAARLLHGILAGIFAAILAGPFSPLLDYVSVPAFYSTVPAGGFSLWWERTVFMFWKMIAFLSVLMGIAGLVIIRNKVTRR